LVKLFTLFRETYRYKKDVRTLKVCTPFRLGKSYIYPGNISLCVVNNKYHFMMPPLKKKILVVEDDEPIRSLYAMKLQQEGFETITAVNGLLGYRAAQTELPDLILLDLRMPIMNGDEMLAKLRATDWGSSMRVVILTNISKSEAPHSLRFMHVDRYVTKVHHTPSQIIGMVREILS
jgi:CheY-like chemotaxis protein